MSWTEKLGHLKDTAIDVLGSGKKINDILNGKTGGLQVLKNLVIDLEERKNVILNYNETETRDIMRGVLGKNGPYPEESQVKDLASKRLQDIINHFNKIIDDPKFSYRASFLTETQLKKSVNDLSGIDSSISNFIKEEKLNLNKKSAEDRNKYDEKHKHEFAIYEQGCKILEEKGSKQHVWLALGERDFNIYDYYQQQKSTSLIMSSGHDGLELKNLGKVANHLADSHINEALKGAVKNGFVNER